MPAASTFRRFAPRLLPAAGVLMIASLGLAQQLQGVRMRGSIESFDGRTLVLKATDGADVTVHVPDNVQVTALVKASLADIKPGAFVGIANTMEPDGSQHAREVHIFPEAQRGTGDGQRAWDFGPKSRMTNGAVDNKVAGVDGQTLTIKHKDGESKIDVPPGTPIVTYAPSDKSELKPGNKVYIRSATKAADGTFDATAVNVGRDGLTPSM
jgi:hypothetical protein